MATPLKIVGIPLSANMCFILHLSKMPDFFTVDTDGHQADSFQIYIAFDPQTPNPSNSYAVDVLIRGEEIHIAHAIRVRDARPSVPDPGAGGWGALRGSVPYELKAEKDGTAILTFNTPFSLLGIVGRFAYELETYNYGASVDKIKGVAP